MKNYSQNNEQQIILNYFQNQTFKDLAVLDLGANDGITLSNSYAILSLGASGDLVEPSPTVFPKLNDLYKNNPNVKCHNVALTDRCGLFPYFESGPLLGENDMSLVSTLKISE